MTYLPRSVQAEAPAGANPLARASSKYMETFQLTQPALGGTDISTYGNVKGNLDIYSVGTASAVFRLRRGSGSQAPYSQTNLGIVGRQLFTYTNDGAKSDNPNIMALGLNGQLKIATFKSSSGTYFQQETKPANATEGIRQFKGVRGLTGNIYFNVILEDGSERPGILANNFFKPGTNEWAGDVWMPMQDENNEPVRAKAIAMAANNPVQTALTAIGEENDLLFSESNDRTARMRILGPKKVTHLSVVTDADDKLNIFATELGTGKLLLKKEKKYSTGGGTQFDDWLYLDPLQDVELTSVFAAQQYNGLLQVFAIDTNGDLHWTGQQAAAKFGKDPTWQTMFPLGNKIASNTADGASIFTVGRTESGYAEAYTVSHAGDVTRFWQSPTTRQWMEEAIQLLRTDDNMVPIQTHALEITIMDELGLPVPNAPLAIQSSALVTLFINGLSYRCSQVDRVAAKAGADGKIVIQQKANALAATTLYIETPNTTPGAPLVVQPNLQLQDKLVALSVDEIKDAKDSQGNYLLPEEYRTDESARSLQEINRAAMGIAGTDENGSGKVNYHFASRDGAGYGFRPQLDLTALEGQNWEIDFTSGFPTYSSLSSEQVATWKAERLLEMPDNGAQTLASGFLGIDWGNVWNGIKNGVSWILDGISKIVVEVVNGIGRVLFHIGGVVFEAVIEFAQQAFDFVQGVWNWLQVKLNQLYEWLAFLFNLGDIVRTADAVRHTMLVTLDYTIDGVESVKKMILSGIDTMKEDLAEVIDAFVADLNDQGNPSIGQIGKDNQLAPEDSYELEHNPFSQAYAENYENAAEKQSTSASLAVDPLDTSLTALLEGMVNLTDNFQFGDGKEAFTEGLNYFTAIGDDPRNALNLLLSGVAKIVESIAFFALDAAKGIIATIMDLIAGVIAAFRDLLFAEWEIPVLSQLYKLFSGKSLSIRLVDIPAYAIAVPTTLIYKMVTGEAPFPDEAALKTFKDYFTVDWLKSKTGIPTELAVKFDSTIEKWVKRISLSIYCGGMFVRSGIDVITGVLSSTGTGVLNISYFSIALRYITTISSAPWLVAPGTPVPSCPPGSPGFSGMIWIGQLLLGPTRGFFIAKKMAPGTPKIYASEVTITLWGAVNAVMVIWNYLATKESPNPNGLVRSLGNIIPGQLGRILYVPGIQKPYFIPAAVETFLIIIGYSVSITGAIQDMQET